jgi:hypothetical protein
LSVLVFVFGFGFALGYCRKTCDFCLSTQSHNI